MKKTTSILVMAALCLFLNEAKAQSQPIHNVQIGQKIPEVTLTNIHNYKTSKLNLADFNTKLIIIDFWATWCTACIANFPKMEQLQNQYKGEVQFLKVTYQKEAEALPFLEKLYKEKPSVIPGVTDDKQLHQLFPHQYLPHYVWIDQTGTLIATTSSREVNQENIDKVLNNTKEVLKIKVDLDNSKPLFLRDELLKYNDIKHYSLFFKGRYDGLPSGVMLLKNKAGRQTGLSISNFQLADMYEYVIMKLYEQRGERYSLNNKIVKVNDPFKILYRRDLTSSEFYTYAYNDPDMQGMSLYGELLNELNRYSDYTGTIEKTKVKCLVLKRTSNTDRLKSSGGKKQNSLFIMPDSKIVNYPVGNLLMQIGELPFIKLPVVDETGYKHMIDIALSQQQPNMQTLQKELKAYDLELVEKEREINMFILKDKDPVATSLPASPSSNPKQRKN